MSLARYLTLSGYALASMGVAAAIAATGNLVTQKGKTFSTSELSISVGQTITFVNDDAVKHNILIKGIDYNSGIQEPGTESTATFDKSGRFVVRCGIHPKMKMTVNVN